MGNKDFVNRAIQVRRRKAEYTIIWRTIIIRIFLLLILAVIAFTHIFGIAIVHGTDMYPALRDGDIVLYYRNADIVNQDAIVYDVNNSLQFGRVEATNGMIIDVTSDGQITIDGNFQPIQVRTGIFSPTYKTESEITYPFTMKEQEYFILGDNRGSANDSRSFGCISREYVKGKIFTVIRRRTV